MKILSRKDIEKIAERVLKAYKNLPENINTDITHIVPELLLTNLLGFSNTYDDAIVRQMIECIEVFKDGTLLIHFGGGYEIEEHI